MRLVDLLYSYLIRIVLLGITYVYLAETRSIGTPDTPTACEPNQNYLVYTTGSCFKFYKLNRLETGELALDRESLRKTNLSDCESSSASFRAFDFYFDTSNQLNLIAFDRNDGTLIGGHLNLTTSAFHRKQVLGTYRSQPLSNQINFVVDRPRRIAYIADKQANRIESLNLVTGQRDLLTADCDSPDFIQVLSGEKLVWTEQTRFAPANGPATCFYEWRFDHFNRDQSNKNSFGKKQLACVKEKVQSFELHNSSIFYITRDGSLFKLYPDDMAGRVASERSAGGLSGGHRAGATKLIYHTVAQKRKYQIQIYRFKLIVRQSAIDLYLSDLNHQALLLANLNNANESNGRYAPKIVFTDQPSLFDFKFIRLTGGDCKDIGSLADSLNKMSSSERIDSLDRIESIGVQMADEDQPGEKTGDRPNNVERLYEQAGTELTEEQSVLSEQMSKELSKELNNVNQLIGHPRTERPAADRTANRPNVQLNVALNASAFDDLKSTSEPSEALCFTCAPNLIYLIVFIVLAVVLVSLFALVVVFLGKRRYNTLIGGEDQSDCRFKWNNIQFNIKKTMQTM